MVSHPEWHLHQQKGNKYLFRFCHYTVTYLSLLLSESSSAVNCEGHPYFSLVTPHKHKELQCVGSALAENATQNCAVLFTQD